MKKAMKVVFVSLCFILMLSGLPVMAAVDEAASDSASVYIRIVNSRNEIAEMLVPRTAVSLAAAVEPVTALQVLQQVAGDAVTVEESEYGAYITELFGIADDGRFSWMYAVNNVLPMVGASEYVLQADDEIVFYYMDWQEGCYTYFSPEALTVNAGERFTLTLMASDFMAGEYPMADAQLVINAPDNVPMPRILYYTDEEGQVSLTFYAAGVYEITARKDIDGVNTIVYPYCAVTVVASGDESFTITTPGGEEGVTLLPETIIPMPMPTVTVIFVADMQAGITYLYGKPVETVLPPILANGLIMVPFRAVMETLGGTVSWDAENARVTATYNDCTGSFAVTDTLHDLPVMLVQDRAYVPASYIVEQFQLNAFVQFSE